MSKTYPVRSSNGSTIIVYGHEQGLRFIWRGGKPLKVQRDAADSTQLNGSRSEAILIDCSDEETVNTKNTEDPTEFEDEDEEYDPSEPYEHVIQTLDLPLGVEVLHLAFPHLPTDLHRRSLPAILSQKIIVAFTCSDYSTRFVTIPLTPPSHAKRVRCELKDAAAQIDSGQSLCGEQIITLSSGISQKSISKGVSMSLTASSSEDPDDVDMEVEDSRSRVLSSRHSSRSRSRARSGLAKDQGWDLLIATHSSDLSGLLLIYRLPLLSEGIDTSSEIHMPWRMQHLASPAVLVEFSTDLYPSSRHSQILVAEEKGAVRIFDCLPQSDSAQGSWLVSLYSHFESTDTPIPRRIPILSARWALAGKAILVLQADGNWGVWNHEGAGPKSSKALNKAQNVSSGSINSFTIDGWIGDSRKTRTLLKGSGGKIDGRSKLAPMTPSTRKMKQDTLFNGPSTPTNGPTRGGLDVIPVQNTPENLINDESILLWYGSNIVVIPSLLTHWQSKIRHSGNLFGSGALGEPKLFNNLQLGGENCTQVTMLSNRNQKKPEVLVTCEKRFLILVPPLAKPEISSKTLQKPLVSATDEDQQMLESGDLDINGMDRILNTMTSNRTSRRNSQLSSRPQSRKSSQGLLLQ